MDIEVWRDIPGYEGEYQVSSEGRIKSLKRKVMSRNRYTRQPFLRTVPERILKPGRYCKAGHQSVVLRRGSNGIPVHQLVMKAFVGEPPEGTEVLHINGNPQDNRLSNLRYGTRTEINSHTATMLQTQQVDCSSMLLISFVFINLVL